MNTTKKIFGVAIATLIVGTVYAQAAGTGTWIPAPCSDPSQCNAVPPLHEGSDSQAKTGLLGLRDLLLSNSFRFATATAKTGYVLTALDNLGNATWQASGGSSLSGGVAGKFTKWTSPTAVGNASTVSENALGTVTIAKPTTNANTIDIFGRTTITEPAASANSNSTALDIKGGVAISGNGGQLTISNTGLNTGTSVSLFNSAILINKGLLQIDRDYTNQSGGRAILSELCFRGGGLVKNDGTLDCKSAWPTGTTTTIATSTLSGGVAGTIPKWTSANTLGNSPITVESTYNRVGVNTAYPNATLGVNYTVSNGGPARIVSLFEDGKDRFYVTDKGNTRIFHDSADTGLALEVMNGDTQLSGNLNVSGDVSLSKGANAGYVLTAKDTTGKAEWKAVPAPVAPTPVYFTAGPAVDVIYDSQAPAGSIKPPKLTANPSGTPFYPVTGGPYSYCALVLANIDNSGGSCRIHQTASGFILRVSSNSTNNACTIMCMPK